MIELSDTKISFTAAMKAPVVLFDTEPYIKRRWGIPYTDVYKGGSYGKGFRVSQAYEKAWIDEEGGIVTDKEDGVIVEIGRELVYARKGEAGKAGLDEVDLKREMRDGVLFWEKRKT